MRTMMIRAVIGALMLSTASAAAAQDKATLDTRELLSEANKPDPAIAAHYLSGDYDTQPTFVRVRDRYKVKTAPPIPVRAPVGMNLSGLSWYASRQTFDELLQGGQWNIDWKVIPSDQLDAKGYPKTWPTTGEVKRLLGAPTGGWVRETQVACTWSGSGWVNYSGGTNIVRGDHAISFTMPSWGGNVKNTWFGISSVNAADPFRDFSCHDAAPGMRSGNEFSKEIVAVASKHPVLRFMDWSQTNGNPALTWETRPDPRTLDNPGLAIENQFRLAELANSDVWFNVGWKQRGNTSYNIGAAKYAAEHVQPGHHVYVELSNEIWNWQFWQANDNLAEATANKVVPTNNGYGAWQNMAIQHIATMKAWEDAFADKPGVLVRVLGTQVAYPEVTRQMMKVPGIADHVDAIAGAPYFSHDRNTAFSFEALRANIPVTVATLKTTCDIVKPVIPRSLCITYEGGQHELVTNLLPQDQFAAVQRDPRMGAAYTEYLTALSKKTGGPADLVMLFNDVDPITKFGAWGQQEYAGQTDAPKRNAIDAFMNANAQ